jgi:hypothetical protein
MASFQAYCPQCEKKVTTHTMLAGSELKAALDSSAEIKVMHIADIDHQWNLIMSEKENLRKRVTEGIVSP